jgi:nucleoside-diphosphate-sugar epimerase
MSPGEQLIDLVYIDDVVEAFIIAADRLMKGNGEAQEDFAVTSGDPILLKELVEEFARACGRPISIQWGGRPYRPCEVMVPWNRGKRLPGWKPKIELEIGLQKLFRTE